MMFLVTGDPADDLEAKVKAKFPDAELMPFGDSTLDNHLGVLADCDAQGMIFIAMGDDDHLPGARDGLEAGVIYLRQVGELYSSKLQKALEMRSDGRRIRWQDMA